MSDAVSLCLVYGRPRLNIGTEGTFVHLPAAYPRSLHPKNTDLLLESLLSMNYFLDS